MSRKKEKANSNRGLLIAVALVVIAIGVASSILLLGKKQQTPSVPVDVYLGVSKYGTINISREDLEYIKKAIEGKYGSLTGKKVVLFGKTTCPHCHNMMNFFENNYKGVVVYIWVDIDEYGSRLFGDLLKKEVGAGFPVSYAVWVPHMLVLGSDGYPRVIVVGDVTKTEFWDGLLK